MTRRAALAVMGAAVAAFQATARLAWRLLDSRHP